MPDAKSLYEQGVAAAKAKDHVKARQLLRDALKLDPNNERGWLWLARVVDDDATRLKAVQRALKINPESETALEMQHRLLQKTGHMTATSEVPPVKAKSDVSPKAKVAAHDSAEKPKNDSDKTKDMPMGNLVASSGIRLPYQFRKAFGLVMFGFIAVILLVSMPRARIPGDSLTFFVGTLAFTGAIALFCLAVLLMTPFGKKISVYENGVVYGGKEKGVVLRWYEIDHVALLRDLDLSMNAPGLLINPMSPLYDMGLYRLNVIKDGNIVFSLTRDFQDYKEVGSMILKLSQPVMVDRWLAEYGRTGLLEFGDITLNSTGIRQGNQSLAWSEMVDVTPYDKKVLVQTTGAKTVTFKPKNISGGVLADIMLGVQHSV